MIGSPRPYLHCRSFRSSARRFARAFHQVHSPNRSFQRTRQSAPPNSEVRLNNYENQSLDQQLSSFRGHHCKFRKLCIFRTPCQNECKNILLAFRDWWRFEEAIKAANAAAEARKDIIERDGKKTVFVIYTGIPPFSRHVCFIDGIDGKIIDLRYEYMD